MPENFISKMSKYVAFLCREADLWELEVDHKDMGELIHGKDRNCYGYLRYVWM